LSPYGGNSTIAAISTGDIRLGKAKFGSNIGSRYDNIGDTESTVRGNVLDGQSIGAGLKTCDIAGGCIIYRGRAVHLIVVVPGAPGGSYLYSAGGRTPGFICGIGSGEFTAIL